MIALSRQGDGAVSFAVKLVPRASKSGIAGIEGDAVKVRVKAPPVEGKANEALVRFLADVLDVSRSQVEIVSGHASRRKVVRIRGVSPDRIEKALSV
ncbi:MAG TPA: DUF167 domain-containing protein [Anaerolineae bacterium]